MKPFSKALAIFSLLLCTTMATAQCVDSSLIQEFYICPAIYAPVCGCNGVTYDNDCIAINAGGVISWTDGVCQNTGCIDESQIDIGVLCPDIFQPVCGCNNVTYGNQCEAFNYGGVTTWTDGACSGAGDCSVEIQDSLINPTYDLLLIAQPTSGVAPYTYSWSIMGAGGGQVIPIYTSANNDTVIVSAYDLFNNFSCVIIDLCMTDATGCQTCMAANGFGNGDFNCLSSFNWLETDSAGVFDIFPSAAIPGFLFQGMTISWGENFEQVNIYPGQTAQITYVPITYNPEGYEFQACVTTFLQSGLCIDCQTMFASAEAGTNSSKELNKANASVQPNPHQNQFSISTLANVKQYTLTDVTGRIVLKGSINGTKTMVNTENLAKGIYFLQIDGSAAIKVVKE